jgi:tetratricopeptide (TPR) repeat protein
VLPAAAVFGQTEDLAAEAHHAKELMAAGRFEEAIPVYRELVSALPNNPGPLMDLGLALHMTGQEREAVSQFQAVLKLEPTQLHAHLFLGAAYLGLNQPDKAIKPLQTVVRVQPDNKEARLLLGEALLSLERLEEAAEQFERLCQLDSENPRAWNGLGLSLEGLANRSFEELQKLAPESAYWLVLAAEARARAGQYKAAFFLYREALRKMPTLRGIYAALADIYKKTGHPDWAAIEEAKERSEPPLDCPFAPAASFATPGPAPHNSLAPPREGRSSSAHTPECDFAVGHYLEVVTSTRHAKTAESFYWRTRACNELARQAYARLGQLPPSAEVHELLAKMFTFQRNWTEAAKEWQEALRFLPGNPVYLQEFAIALSTINDFEGARQILVDLIKQSPDSVGLNHLLGSVLLSLQKADEALPFLEKAVRLDPAVLDAQRDLGRAYLRLGKGEMAIPHLKAALPTDKDGNVYYQLASAYHQTGQKDMEREMLKKFREIQTTASRDASSAEEKLDITAP